VHPNAKTIESFYTAFAALDADGMNRCYDESVVRFSDPVFTDLRGAEVTGMWRMLCARATNFDLTFDDVDADDESGRAHWVARYTFAKTKRPVVNDIRATFVFDEGRIVQHRDVFDLWKWAGQALQHSIRKEARKNLERFLAKSG
jgi:ketosteroid isomerase-like protein